MNKHGPPYASDDWQSKGYASPEEEIDDMANVGRSLMEALPHGYCYMDSPSEIVTDLQNEIDELKAASVPSSRVEKCANCGFERREHTYNGACYGLCGEFQTALQPSPSTAGEVEKLLSEWQRLEDAFHDALPQGQGETGDGGVAGRALCQFLYDNSERLRSALSSPSVEMREALEKAIELLWEHVPGIAPRIAEIEAALSNPVSGTDERALIVAWLRRQAEPLSIVGDKRHILLGIAEEVERGEHRPAPPAPLSEDTPNVG